MSNPTLRSFATRVNGLSLCLLATLLFAGAAAGQTQITTGAIQGTILDANGAAVPGASVEVKNDETNFSRTATSDEDGRFVALQLPPGRYTVTVSKSGFATLTGTSSSGTPTCKRVTTSPTLSGRTCSSTQAEESVRLRRDPPSSTVGGWRALALGVLVRGPGGSTIYVRVLAGLRQDERPICQRARLAP